MRLLLSLFLAVLAMLAPIRAQEAPEKIEASGVCYFADPAIKELEKRAGRPVLEVSHPSSNDIADDFLTGKIRLGFMSIELTPEQKAAFAHSNGHPALEVKVAQDAIQAIVNAECPLRTITMSQLRAVFEQEAPEGGRKPIRDWAQLGQPAGVIKVFGGAAEWGTTRVFQREVMGDRAFRNDLHIEGVGAEEGVETEVAKDKAAVGFASLPLNKSTGVRALTISRRKGDQAWGPDAESIASGDYPLQRCLFACLAAPSIKEASAGEREILDLLLSSGGQALVMQAGDAALTPDDLREARAKLDLPGRP